MGSSNRWEINPASSVTRSDERQGGVSTTVDQLNHNAAKIYNEIRR